ncbi:hypothetical protein ACFXCZ_35445 [Streptomyces sp. NPDC059396]|uniref:hypothetical protein n=1 Tax=Streptomyces sp. NPDC059396 TaxID=3346819 RepID=UPI0036838D6C
MSDRATQAATDLMNALAPALANPAAITDGQISTLETLAHRAHDEIEAGGGDYAGTIRRASDRRTNGH